MTLIELRLSMNLLFTKLSLFRPHYLKNNVRSVYEMGSDSDSTKEGAELRMRGERCSRRCTERRHKIFNDCAEYLPALSSRLQVHQRFSYLLNKNSQV